MELRHARVSIWLEPLRDGEGPPLLLLHELGGSSADWADRAEGPAGWASWPGPVHALDFAGHGRSGRLAGGAYLAELLVGDADAALAALGPCWLAGAGLGAYVALLLAGGRPDPVRGGLLWPGRGLAGGGPEPDPTVAPRAELPPSGDAPGSGLRTEPATDPLALSSLEGDLRPPDYAETFGAAASGLLWVEDGEPRPPWWHAARDASGAETVGADAAFETLARRARAEAAS